MKLNTHKLQLTWPDELPPEHLRPWLLRELKSLGKPLRWAITLIRPCESGSCRLIIVEAVVIKGEK
ncbi:hypothetical protein [Prochlorococcus sp. MIT 1341]|uniref:hypothetical protein n=1 Tax=Prochlorococcus sp. MIT 1341 TaxID=3096221 RepID=UPI002A74989C|nr:hypothetical protein [Prochlorococcus sp. MIT 1341]